MNKTKCSICGVRFAETKLESTVTISAICGILKSREEIDTLYVCEHYECISQATSQIKRSARGMISDEFSMW